MRFALHVLTNEQKKQHADTHGCVRRCTCWFKVHASESTANPTQAAAAEAAVTTKAAAAAADVVAASLRNASKEA